MCSNILNKVKFNKISVILQFFISFFILKIVVECPEEIFKKLLSVTVYLYDILEILFLKARHMIN